MVANRRCDRPEESGHPPTVGSRVMARTVRLIIGALLVLVGAVWIFQGIGAPEGLVHDRRGRLGDHRRRQRGDRCGAPPRRPPGRVTRSVAPALRRGSALEGALAHLVADGDDGRVGHRPPLPVGAVDHERVPRDEARRTATRGTWPPSRAPGGGRRATPVDGRPSCRPGRGCSGCRRSCPRAGTARARARSPGSRTGPTRRPATR